MSTTSVQPLTEIRACQLGEEAQRKGIVLADAVQEFRREHGASVTEKLVNRFTLGWIATSLADRSVPVSVEGAD